MAWIRPCSSRVPSLSCRGRGRCPCIGDAWPWEKNIEAFLDLDLPGTKYVVGDGPDLNGLRSRYPDVRFVGQKHGEELAAHLAAAGVFVFPSLTDTFGLVMLEAMACGVPVAAFPVTGPLDVVQHGKTGVLDRDLRAAVIGALELDPSDCVAYAKQHTWLEWTRRFVFAAGARRLSSVASVVSHKYAYEAARAFWLSARPDDL